MFSTLGRKNKKLLLEKLEELDKIPSINRGGCAIVASHLKTFVEREFNVKTQVVYFFGSLDYSLDAKSYKNLKENKPDSCKHALLRIGKRYFDTECHHEHLKGYTLKQLKNEGLEVHLEVPDELLEKSIRKRRIWNPEFDRRRVRIIRRILGT